MKTTDLFPSKWIKADDLDSGPQTVAIRELAIEEIGQGKNRQSVRSWQCGIRIGASGA